MPIGLCFVHSFSLYKVFKLHYFSLDFLFAGSTVGCSRYVWQIESYCQKRYNISYDGEASFYVKGKTRDERQFCKDHQEFEWILYLEMLHGCGLLP